MSVIHSYNRTFGESLVVLGLENSGIADNYISTFEKSGKVFLPRSFISNFELSDQNFATYRLTNPRNGFSTDVGVADFTAIDGQIYIPDWIIKKIKIPIGQNVIVNFINLKPLSSITFETDDEDFARLPDTSKVSLLNNLSFYFTAINIGDKVFAGNYILTVNNIKSGNPPSESSSANIIGNLDPHVDFVISEKLEFKRLEDIQREEEEKLRREQRKRMEDERKISSKSTEKSYKFNPLNAKPVSVNLGKISYPSYKPVPTQQLLPEKNKPFSGSGNMLGSLSSYRGSSSADEPRLRAAAAAAARARRELLMENQLITNTNTNTKFERSLSSSGGSSQDFDVEEALKEYNLDNGDDWL